MASLIKRLLWTTLITSHCELLWASNALWLKWWQFSCMQFVHGPKGCEVEGMGKERGTGKFSFPKRAIIRWQRENPPFLSHFLQLFFSSLPHFGGLMALYSNLSDSVKKPLWFHCRKDFSSRCINPSKPLRYHLINCPFYDTAWPWQPGGIDVLPKW